MDHIKRNPNVRDIGIFVSGKPKPKGLKVWREQKPKVLFSTLGIAFAEAGFIWNNAVNPDFIQAERLEGMEGTKTQSAF